MTWADFLSNLSSELIATLIGIILGIPAGVWLNNLIDKRHKKKEQLKEKDILEKLKIEILTHLEDEIKINVTVLRAIKKAMPEKFPYVTLKTSTWKSFTVRELTLLQTYTFYKKTFNLYFMFEDFIKNFAYIIDLSHRLGTALTIPRMLQELKDKTVNLIPKVLNECDLLLEEIKKVKGIDD